MREERITLEDFDDLVKGGEFNFLQNEINGKLEDYLARVRRECILLLVRRNDKATGIRSDMHKTRKKLKTIALTLNDLLQDDRLIRDLAIELERREHIDHKKYFPGQRKHITPENPEGRLYPFDENRKWIKSEYRDYAHALESMLQGLARSCSLQETWPAKKGRPIQWQNLIPAYSLLEISTEFGMKRPNATEAPNQPFYRALKLIFQEKEGDELKKIIGKILTF